MHRKFDTIRTGVLLRFAIAAPQWSAIRGDRPVKPARAIARDAGADARLLQSFVQVQPGVLCRSGMTTPVAA